MTDLSPPLLRLHTYDEAAEILRVEEHWLRRNIKRLPHVKMGKSVLFTDDDLKRIVAAHHYEPEQLIVRKSGTGSHPLAHLKPLPPRTLTSA